MKIVGHHKMMWSFTKSLITSFKRPVFLYLISLSFTIIFISAVLIFHFEQGTNDKVTTFMDALYYTVTITTGVGLGDIVPITETGRVISMLIMLLGTGIFVSFTAVLAVSILEIELEHKKNNLN